MRKIKICKKLSKLKFIDCSDMDCVCLKDEEFVAVDDLIEYLKGKGITKYHLIGKLLNTRKQSKVH